ncbi:MAG: universal stress protein [Desertifilum sp. SIO1I2]|nr:universal stress protein [Desertifilum sp. SIO1I2]
MTIINKWLLPRGRIAIAEACAIGFVSGLSAVFLKEGVNTAGGWRIQLAQQLPPLLALPLVGIVFGFIAGFLVERFAPETTGGGIPQVKSALAGVPVALNWRVALVKLGSCILSLSSGMTLGRQGPTVHIGAALASELSRIVPTSPSHRRQLIAAGAAAGLAAGFNAPIAGVLFVVEELLHDFSELTLGTAILASFIGAVVSRLLGGQSLNVNLDLATYTTSFSAPEIPFYILLGLLAGVFGTLFNQGILTALAVNRRWRVRMPVRVAIAGAISGIAIALLPASFQNHTGLREFLLTGDATAIGATVAFISHFLLTCIAYGSGAPGGLFAPALLLGASLGYLIGLLEMHTLGNAAATTYALAGMGAFFSAVAKVPITGIVIIFEMTTDFNLVLPLMIGSVTAYLIADALSKTGVYNRLLEWNGVSLSKEPSSNNFLRQLTAADVMQRRVETLSSQLPLAEVAQAFSRSHHRGFPVVNEGVLVGIVTQTDLAKMESRALPGETPLSEIMTPDPVTVRLSDSLSEVLYRLDRYKLSRLPVTEGRKLVGIITRSDIIRVESDRLNFKTPQGPKAEPSYVVYQTRSPATGRGRLLVPIANPQTAHLLVRTAAAIAREKHYELECLSAIVVSKSDAPDRTPVDITKTLELLQEVSEVASGVEIPIHTQIRTTHDIAQAILETIQERNIDLILMGWKGQTSTPGRIFGSVVDTLIRQAPCDVLLVKWGNPQAQNGASLKGQSVDFRRDCYAVDEKANNGRGFSRQPLAYSPISTDLSYCPLPLFNRYLIPMAGGPNCAAAVRLIPALVRLSQAPEIQLCQIFEPGKQAIDTQVMQSATDFLNSLLKCPINSIALRSPSVTEAVIQLTKQEQCDVVIVGASREGLLKQAWAGNIPEAIALQCDCTVILFRQAVPPEEV